MSNIGWLHPKNDAGEWDGFNDSGMEHFAGDPNLHLAREVNQNSYDAATGEPVKVVIKLVEEETQSIPNIEEYIQTIELCKTASEEESEKAIDFFKKASNTIRGKKINVLQIEDFNTSGIEGPAKLGKPYYAFMKAKGQSKKTANTASGSYGIGKFAPYAVSGLRTVFVSTVYEDENKQHKQITQGKSILITHDAPDGSRRQGTGYWGIKDGCEPVEGTSTVLPVWVQKTTEHSNLKNHQGTKISIIDYKKVKNWEEQLANSVAENFFGAIVDGKLEIDINDKYRLTKGSILDFFSNEKVQEAISNNENEPDAFKSCKEYLKCLMPSSPGVITETKQSNILGLIELKIRIEEGLQKKVCILRNGMFITETLQGMKRFSDFKDFIAVFQCKDPKGISLLRAMEPPRHDEFEPKRLNQDEKKGKKALEEISKWVRDMLKRHARNPVSETTTLSELAEFFADDSGGGAGASSTEDIDPNGEIILRARPVRPKPAPRRPLPSNQGTGGSESSTGTGRGKGSGSGGNGAGSAGGDTGSGSGSENKSPVPINNVRAVRSNSTKQRRVFFTPKFTGKIRLKVMVAGADFDENLRIIGSSSGATVEGEVECDVFEDIRFSLDIEIEKEYDGSIKVIAYEI